LKGSFVAGKEIGKGRKEVEKKREERDAFPRKILVITALW